MTTPSIEYNPDGSLSCLSGREAVDLYRVQTIISGIRMNIATGGKMQLTRGATITHLLGLASQYTGRPYKRTEKEQAMADLQVWFANMRSTIPEVTR